MCSLRHRVVGILEYKGFGYFGFGVWDFGPFGFLGLP